MDKLCNFFRQKIVAKHLLNVKSNKLLKYCCSEQKHLVDNILLSESRHEAFEQMSPSGFFRRLPCLFLEFFRLE